MSATPLFTPVVEGDGEVHALPVLLRRVCSEMLGEHHIDIRPPWRVPRGRMKSAAEIGRVTRVLATACRDRRGGVLVLYDLDDDPCPVASAAEVARHVVGDTRSEVVVACREFEAWFLASAPALATHRAVIDGARFYGEPESPRDAKGRLEQLMVEQYRPTLHQAAFCGLMDLDEAHRQCRSFRRFVSAVSTLLSD